jgi:hypothetical protein
MEVVWVFETTVNFFKTTHHIPEDMLSIDTGKLQASDI